MDESLLSKLVAHEDINSLNRLVATGQLDKNVIISKFKEVPPELYLNNSDIHGYGVFTKYPIKRGQLIEIVHIITLDFRSKYHKDKTILDYCYALPETSDEANQHGHKLFMFTGLGMMYNHNKAPQCNAKWLWDLQNNKAKLIATQNIIENTEITIDYGTGYWKNKS